MAYYFVGSELLWIPSRSGYPVDEIPSAQRRRIEDVIERASEC